MSFGAKVYIYHKNLSAKDRSFLLAWQCNASVQNWTGGLHARNIATNNNNSFRREALGEHAPLFTHCALFESFFEFRRADIVKRLVKCWLETSESPDFC
jgi:hypothetical protein